MIETIITSSILILIITTLRYLLRNKISSRLQYALWVLVAIRLLLPFSLFESPISVMNAVPNAQSYYPIAVQPVAPGSQNQVALQGDRQTEITVNAAASDSPVKPISYDAIAQYIWLCGLFVSGVFFIVSNVRLNRTLRQSRMQIEVADYSLPVYTADCFLSPCLYGIVKPSVYLTPQSLLDDQTTAYVLAHELTHCRHKDHIWSFVRVLCLCIYWFNPLVWLAVVLSRRDSELACDEGTLRRIGNERRIEYGKTLLEMLTAPATPSNLFCCTTSMTGGKGEMTERIKRIAKQPRMLATTLIVVIILAVVAVGCTFGGAVNNEKNSSTQANNLWSARTQYVGDNSAVGKLIGLLPVPEDLTYDHFILHTKEQPYSIEIVYAVSPDALTKYEAVDSQTLYPIRKNALLMLALIENADRIWTTLTTNEGGEVRFTNVRDWANDMVGSNLRDYNQSPEKLQELIDFPIVETNPIQYSIVALGKNGELVAEMSLDNKQLAEAIINNATVKSAAWEGTDINTLEVSYRIRQTFTESQEINDFYAYVLDDGTPVLQFETNGMYTIISQDLYSELVESFGESATPNDNQLYQTQSFTNVTDLNITGYLQHIVVKPASGNEVVIRWVSDGTETVKQENGQMYFSFAEPNWLDKTLSNDGSPRFSVVSTLYVELPETIDAVTLDSILGDITIGGVNLHNQLVAHTVNGNIVTHGLVGVVKAETGEGTIGPASFGAEITEQPYSQDQTSKHLNTTIPGATNPAQYTELYTVLGSISINE